MTSRVARAGLIAIEAAGVLLAAAIAGILIVAWRVQAGPVALDALAPAVKAAANAGVFDGGVRRIDQMTLVKSDAPGEYSLILQGVRLGRDEADHSAALPRVELVFALDELFGPDAGPTRILIDRPEIRIIRRTDKRLRIDFGDPAAGRASFFQALTGGTTFRDSFERADLRRAHVVFVDRAARREWIAREANASIVQTPAGYTAFMEGEFDVAGRSARLRLDAAYDLETEVISSELFLTDAPVGDLLNVFFHARGGFLTSPVTGEAKMDISKDGEILSSFIRGRAGAGVLSIGKWRTGIQSIAAAAGFNPEENRFEVRRFTWSADAGSGSMAGIVSLDMADAGLGVEKVLFSLDGEAITVAAPAAFDEPLQLDDFSAQGAYDVDARTLAISDFETSVPGLAVAGDLKIAASPKGDGASPAIHAALQTEGALDKEGLLRIWPKQLASAARDFVKNRIPKGSFSDVDAAVALAAGALDGGQPLPQEALKMTFAANGATVVYAPGMTPLSEVSGRGALTGNSFLFDLRNARAGEVAIEKGGVRIPVLAPKGEPAHFHFAAVGDASDILTILAQEPLAVLDETGLSADQFRGEVRFEARITRPNLRVAPRKDYHYAGVAEFSGVAVENLFGGASLERAAGRLNIDENSMTVAADAVVGASPVAIEWTQALTAGSGRSRFEITGTADASMADIFGVPTRQMMRGSAPFEATAIGDIGRFRSVEITADLTGAALVSEALDWMKPPGDAASLSARIELAEEGARLSRFTLDGEDIAVIGSARFDPSGRLRSAEFPTVRLKGAADLSVSAATSGPGALGLTVTGDYFDAAPLVRSLIGGDLGGAWTGGQGRFRLTARLARVLLRGGAAYSDASVDYRRADGEIEALSVSARDAGGRPFSVSLRPTGEHKGRQAVEARSDNIGGLLGGVFGLQSVKGGEGVLRFLFTPGGDETGAGAVGAFEARNLRVVQAPLLAKIFAAASLTGLADVANGSGIEFSNAFASFRIEGGRILVDEARATGSAVGVTAQGSFDLEGERTVDLSGAVAPAYGVNSLLGNAPVIGELFVSRKGEGLLALSYEVEGPAAGPTVTVNPLSALAPGVFRRMFEGQSEVEEAAGN